MNRYLAQREALRRLILDLAPIGFGRGDANATGSAPAALAAAPNAAPAASAVPPTVAPAVAPAEARQVLRDLEPLLLFSRPPDPQLGDLSLAVFPVAKILRKPPVAVAQEWAAAVREDLARPESPLRLLEVPPVKVEAHGPYLNLTLDLEAQARLTLESVIAGGARYGRSETPTGQTVMVEYSSPNTNKPLHLGHVRNNLIGMSISNILEATGDRVVRVSLINDRGIHICKSMLAYQRWGHDALTGEPETPHSTGEKGDHFVGRYYVLFNTRLNEERRGCAAGIGIDLSRFEKKTVRALADKDERRRREVEAEQFEAEFLASSELMAGASDLLRRWEAGDAEVLQLWRTMNEWVYQGFRETYVRLGCRFDRWYFESETWRLGKQEVERGLELGAFYRLGDGSVWARLEPLGLKDKILLRSDGTSVYITQDVGTAIRKVEDYAPDRSIYVVASEQEDHFRNLFAILKLLGFPWAERCVHASYNMVNLPKGMGKLKSREGTSADVDDLLDELKRLASEKIAQGGYAEDPDAATSAAEWIGQGAMKLYILQVSPEKAITFDPSETIAFTGDTGPAVQYSHARIHGILRKALAAGKVSSEEIVEARPLSEEPRPPAESVIGALPEISMSGPFLREDRARAGLLREPEEREVLKHLADFPDVLASARRQLSSAPVANAMLDLTKAYARMYHAHEVLRAESPDLLRARLQLALCVAQVLRNGLSILTIEAPERM